jgi:hypothetical protein
MPGQLELIMKIGPLPDLAEGFPGLAGRLRALPDACRMSVGRSETGVSLR